MNRRKFFVSLASVFVAAATELDVITTPPTPPSLLEAMRQGNRCGKTEWATYLWIDDMLSLDSHEAHLYI
jgi:hypothetical protein